MKRSDKRTLLNQLLQGRTSSLHALKQERNKSTGLFIIADYPADWFGNCETSDAKVRACYSLTNGSKITEWLTYAELMEKAGDVLIMLPDNRRNRHDELRKD